LNNNLPIINKIKDINNKLGIYLERNSNITELNRIKLKGYLIDLKKLFFVLGGKANEKKIV
jgi:hypothetical protein